MFDKIRKVAEIIDLANDLQNLDADKDGKEDWKEFLELANKLSGQYAEVQDTFNEIARLFGSDVAAIRQKLGA